MKRRDFLSTSLGLAVASALAPAQQAQASSDSSTNFDIAIIGAGLFGSAAARHLSKVNDGVALIGPEEPQQKSTHQGVFASHYDTSRLTRIIDPNLVWGTLAKRSIARYRDIERQSSIEFFHNIGYMMVTPGGLGADWFDLPAMREVATDLNVEIEDFDDELLKQRFPYLNVTPGSSAVLQEKDAGYFNPRLLVEAQQTIAIAQGTTLLREEVVQIQLTGPLYLHDITARRSRANTADR